MDAKNDRVESRTARKIIGINRALFKNPVMFNDTLTELCHFPTEPAGSSLRRGMSPYRHRSRPRRRRTEKLPTAITSAITAYARVNAGSSGVGVY